MSIYLTCNRNVRKAITISADRRTCIPVHLDDWVLLGIQWNGETLADTRLPFGLHSVPKLFNKWLSQMAGLEWCIHPASGLPCVSSPILLASLLHKIVFNNLCVGPCGLHIFWMLTREVVPSWNQSNNVEWAQPGGTKCKAGQHGWVLRAADQAETFTMGWKPWAWMVVGSVDTQVVCRYPVPVDHQCTRIPLVVKAYGG